MHELALRLILDDATVDVVAAVDDHHAGSDLTRALAEHLGLDPHREFANQRTGTSIVADRPVADIDLLSGDSLCVDGAARGTAPNAPNVPRTALALDIVGGPAAGESTVLRAGAATIGRSSQADITVADPTVSRVHATLSVAADGSIALTAAPGAGNGVSVEGAPVEVGDGVTVTEGEVVELGGTRAVVRRFERQPCDQRDRLGQLAFHRTPYRPPTVDVVDTAPVGPIPVRPEPRRLQLIAVLAPLVAGVAMYLITGQATFLLFTLISPVVMIGTAVDDRRTGRRNFTDDLVAFRSMLVARRREFDALAGVERRRRHEAAPDVAQLVRRSELRTIDLWARGRDAPDALRLRVGLGDARAAFDIELATGGDADLRAEAERAMLGADRLSSVPVTHDLVEGHLAVHGDPVLVDGLANALLVQVATLHSPDDVAIAAVVAPERNLQWVKWLPHLRAVTSPVGGPHLAVDADGADALVGRLLDVAERRTAEQTPERADHWPRVVAVLDATLRPDPTAVARLLDRATAAGISVIWLADRAAEVPRQVGAVLAVRRVDGARLVGRLWTTDPAEADRDVEVEHVRPTVAERAARSLAPVRDASTASLATSIPRTVPLFDVLAPPTVEAIAATWQAAREPSLPFAIGVGADGTIELDLVGDGPHTLIGGTSGAGKSELLQSMVASLATRHSPERLNFLFVDYKGGASSQVFERLPHTVGYVTNLSADLARRALVSLRAELQRRMSLLEGRAKDLAELFERDPADTPPSLVIVVDEFATLVNEVPDFVAGIVDIAQRGRSLGIHLVLATQRPTGAVDENILANTNLRISLRMLDRSESSAIIDSPDAADIPAPLRGRGLVRLGPQNIAEFQSAYASAPATEHVARPPVVVAAFDGPDATATSAATPTVGAATQLDAVLDAIAAATDMLGIPRPRRPWREVLPPVVTLDEVWSEPEGQPAVDEPGRAVVIGRYDAPEQQAQGVAIVDLEQTGGLVVFGTGGAGKTTVLRTIAAGVERAGGNAVSIVFDFASRGLTSLRALPSVVDVATGDDLEAVTRHLLVLDTELRRRRAALGESGAEHLTAHHGGGGERFERIVLLVDGFGAFAEALLDPLAGVSSGDAWHDVVHRLVIDGRQVGIHTVITADRRAAVPSRFQSAVGARLVLRHADPQSYADHGVSAARAATLDEIAGRAVLDNVTVQVAVAGADPSARGQADGLGRLARSSAPDSAPRLPQRLVSRCLPDRLTPDMCCTGAIGVADVSGAPVVVDLEWSHATIVGPSRSGRSTALAAALDAVEDTDASAIAYVIGSASSPLADLSLPAGRARFGRAPVVAELLDRLADRLAAAPPDERVVLFIDDVDTFDDPMLEPLWTRLLDAETLRIVATMETRSMSGYTTSAVVNELRRVRRLLVLQPDDPTEFLQLTGTKLAIRPGVRLVPGRGVLLVDRQPTLVQIVDVLSGDHRPADRSDRDSLVTSA